MCGSPKLILYDILWPFSILFKKHFKCPMCGWSKDKNEVLRKGGLEAFGAKKGSARKGSSHHRKKSNWTRIGRLPNWSVRKMKKKRTNKVYGDNYVYLRKGKKFYKRRK